MRIIISIVVLIALVVSGWFIWHGIVAEPGATQDITSDTASPLQQEPHAPRVQRSRSMAPTIANTPAAEAPEAVEGPSPEEQRTKELIDAAVDAYNTGDYDTSLQRFTEALTYDRSALTGVGLSHYQLHDYRKAVSVLERSLQENGDEFTALKFLSLAYYKMDNLEKSQQSAQRALSLNEEDELRTFYERLQREQNAMTNRVDESNLHFKIIFDGYEYGSISYLILGILDDAYREVGREFGHFPDRPITVVLYSSEGFFDVTQAPAWSGGQYDGKIRMPIKGIESIDKNVLRRVLYHEYVHAMVHDIATRVPRWFNEGLAEYLAPRGMEHIGQTIPLGMLDSAFLSNDTRVAGIAYQQSYSIVAHLVDRYSLYDIKQFLLALGRGDSMEQAFYDTFIITFDEFASTWGRG